MFNFRVSVKGKASTTLGARCMCTVGAVHRTGAGSFSLELSKHTSITWWPHSLHVNKCFKCISTTCMLKPKFQVRVSLSSLKLYIVSYQNRFYSHVHMITPTQLWQEALFQRMWESSDFQETLPQCLASKRCNLKQETSPRWKKERKR